jgi:hypothetical protein
LKSKSRVKAVRVPRPKQNDLEPRDIRVLKHGSNEGLAKAAAPKLREYKDVGQVSDYAVVGDNPTEGDLLPTQVATKTQ